MEWLARVHGTAPPSRPPTFSTGDDVRVWFKLSEQGRERLGQFEGVVIRVRGSGRSKTFTVRRMTYGVGVERVFPLDAPIIDRIEVLRRGKAKRSRLYFLRGVVKKTRLASAEETEGTGQAPPPTAAGDAPPSSASTETEAAVRGDQPPS
jgi:large subunit ribosomal protein L19